MRLIFIFVGLCLMCLIVEAENMDEHEGLEIQIDSKTIKQNGVLEINGTFSMFVNCGSQYATWNQFPQTIIYVLKDLHTEEVFESVDNELSISWNGNNVYEMYSKEPCNKVVKKEFSVLLNRIYFKNRPDRTIDNFELSATYFGFTSNLLIVKDFPLVLNGF